MCISISPQHNHMLTGSAADIDTPPSTTFTPAHHHSSTGHRCSSFVSPLYPLALYDRPKPTIGGSPGGIGGFFHKGRSMARQILQRVSRVAMLFDFNTPLLPAPHDHTNFDQTSFSTLSSTHGMRDHHHQTAFHRGYHHHRARHHRSSHRHGRSQGHYRRVENRGWGGCWAMLLSGRLVTQLRKG
ncbi:hypothetical protein FOZ60_002569 [Perkinsus olseni]|uniref:Uncharacterized protein n=1 Tax=Perkinsus olseni TaxID=32597 RepID=A0A7J6NXP4_PEROL|nr:hypothetical protein FOZ60_002569 [Perkinsus olseni]